MSTAQNRQTYLVPGTAAELRDVPGYEGQYGVTRDGRVWSHARTWVNGKGAPQSHNGMWLNAALSGGPA